MFVFKPLIYRCFNHLPVISLLLCLLVLNACDGNSKTEEHLDHVTSRISKEIISTKNDLQDLLPSQSDIEKTSSKEIEKTFTIEYQAIEIKSTASIEDLQKTLTTLGKERWDCFALTPSIEGSRLLCKRRPHSALRAILGAGGIQ